MNLDEITLGEQANLPQLLFARWRAAVFSKGPLGEGEYEDLLTELWDWFNDVKPIDPYALNATQAAEVHHVLADEFGLASDTEEELHRVKYLRLGTNRTAEQVLEDLVQQEVEARQRREAMTP